MRLAVSSLVSQCGSAPPLKDGQTSNYIRGYNRTERGAFRAARNKIEEDITRLLSRVKPPDGMWSGRPLTY